MKDTIEVPVELVKKLKEWADHKAPFDTVRELVKQLPTLEPVLEPCPACGSLSSLAHPGADRVRCSNQGCAVKGPDYDPDGSKWNAMARSARMLRDLMANLRAGGYDSLDEALCDLKERGF